MGEQRVDVREPFQVYVADHPLTDSYNAAQAALGSGQLEEAADRFADEPVDSPCYGLALGYRALTLFRLGRLEEAERAVNVAMAELKRVGSPHHPSAVQFMRTRGDILVQQGRPAEAVPRYEETIEIAEAVAREAPKDADAIEREIAHTRNSLGVALLRVERTDDAISEFMKARDTYRKFPKQAWSGLSEVLTNLAEAWLAKNQPDPGRAEAALSEALDVARKEANADQLWRTQMKLIQLGSKQITATERDAIFTAGVDDAVRQGRWGAAYVRRCIEAQVASEDGRASDGLRAVADASAIEQRLDPADPHPAQLRLTQARLLSQARASAPLVLKVLVEGAHLWFRRLGRPLTRDDFRRTTAASHDHFRLLSRKLLDAGLPEESLVAFEAGRALGYAGEVNPHLPAKLFATAINPFASDGSNVHTTPLLGLRNWVGNGVVVVPTVLPPEFVAFVLSGKGVATARVTYPDPAAAAGNREAAEALFRSIVEIPHLLANDRTSSATAVPASLRELAGQIRGLVGDRPVRMIAPHADLHKVPWRALLRDRGIPWQRMPCATEFSLLLRGQAGAGDAETTVSSAIGLGHGDALGLDFCDEAKAFVAPFGASGVFANTCTVQDVKQALSTERDAAIVSTHGGMKRRLLDSPPVFSLDLQGDGGRTVEAYIDEWLPPAVKVRVVDLSACSSGVYEMGWGDYPAGAGPALLLRGARYCVACRYPIRVPFALALSKLFARRLAEGKEVCRAMAEALAEAESQADGWSRWRDLACVELLGRPYGFYCCLAVNSSKTW